MVRIFDTGDSNERTPMLSKPGEISERDKRRAFVNVRTELELGEVELKEDFTTRRRYLRLTLICFCLCSIIFLTIILVSRLRHDKTLMKATNKQQRTELDEAGIFMRLYEEIMELRPSPDVLTDAVIGKLSKEQLELAHRFGIFSVIDGTSKSSNKKQNTFPSFTKIDEHQNGTIGCNIQCMKADVSIPPLVVISLDGFAHKYLDRGLVPSLDVFAECGAKAEIWSFAVRNHRRTNCMFWPGCSFNITGAHSPTIDVPYVKSMPFSERVDKIVEWLLLSPHERPSLILAYFDQPDSAGHYHTSEKQVNLELRYVDVVLRYLLRSLQVNSLLDCTNLLILSDHGMHSLNNRYYLNDLFRDRQRMLISPGVISRVYMRKDSSNVSDGQAIDLVADSLTQFDSKRFRIYDRRSIPKRYHYSKSATIGNVILDGQPGTTFCASTSDPDLTSDHGYDYLSDSMQAIFFARGPNIKPGSTLPPFQNVEYFNLFVYLLRLPHETPNNGTRGVLEPILDNVDLQTSNLEEPLDVWPVPECAPNMQQRKLTSCATSRSDALRCSVRAELANKMLAECGSGTHNQPPHQSLIQTESPADLCISNQCSVVVVSRDSKSSSGKPSLSAAVIELLSDKGVEMVDSSATPSCLMFESASGVSSELECERWIRKMNQSPDVVLKSLMFNRQNGLEDSANIRFLAHKEFAHGPFVYLQNATKKYTRRFGKLVSITGTIFDENLDGLADGMHDQETKSNDQLREGLPTHVFRILIRCEDRLWHIDGKILITE